jgi:hypothetical protein
MFSTAYWWISLHHMTSFLETKHSSLNTSWFCLWGLGQHHRGEKSLDLLHIFFIMLQQLILTYIRIKTHKKDSWTLLSVNLTYMQVHTLVLRDRWWNAGRQRKLADSMWLAWTGDIRASSQYTLALGGPLHCCAALIGRGSSQGQRETKARENWNGAYIPWHMAEGGERILQREIWKDVGGLLISTSCPPGRNFSLQLSLFCFPNKTLLNALTFPIS